jgi:hemoglobin
MSPLEDNQICEHLGEDTISAIVAAFYRRVPADDVLGPMYPGSDFAGAEARLRSFLIFRFGGSQNYLEERGHPNLRIRHAPFALNTKARDRWIQLMDAAIVECQIAENAAAVMRQFFDTAATFLINSPDT